jgi:hypothetical protein
MSVVEGVVGVLLIVEGSDAGTFEPGAETELPHERALDVACKRARGSAVRRESHMEMVIGGAERQEPALFALLQHDPGDDAERRRCGGERPVVLEPDGHVKSDGLP